MNNEFKYYVGQEWLMWEDDIEQWRPHIIVISRYLDLTERIEIVLIDKYNGTPVAEPVRLVASNESGCTYIPRKYFEKIAYIEGGFEWKPADKQERIEYHRVAGIGDYFKEQGRNAVYLLSSAGISSKGHSRLVLINIATGGRLGKVVEVQDVNNISERELLELNHGVDTLHKLKEVKL